MTYHLKSKKKKRWKENYFKRRRCNEEKTYTTQSIVVTRILHLLRTNTYERIDCAQYIVRHIETTKKKRKGIWGSPFWYRTAHLLKEKTRSLTKRKCKKKKNRETGTAPREAMRTSIPRRLSRDVASFTCIHGVRRMRGCGPPRSPPQATGGTASAGRRQACGTPRQERRARSPPPPRRSQRRHRYT